MRRAGGPLLLGVLALLAPAAAGAVRGSGAPAPSQATRHDVHIRAFRFEPRTVRVAPGDTVVWKNHDMVPHTVSSPEGGWDSDSIDPGASWTLIVPAADSAGYLCDFHLSMTGLVVASASTSSPTGSSSRP